MLAAAEAARHQAWLVESQQEYTVAKVLGAKTGRAGQVLHEVEWEGGKAKWGAKAVGWSKTVDPEHALRLMKKQLLGRTCLVWYKPGLKLHALVSQVQGKKFFVKYTEDPNRDHDEWLDLVNAEKIWSMI